MAAEYIIGQVGEGKFTVAKFEPGEPLPRVVYNVSYNHVTGRGKCDCPAAMYRGTGAQDKHVLMVAGWLATGRTAFNPHKET